LFAVLAVFFFVTACREDEKIIAYRKLTDLPPAELEQRVTALPPREQVAMYAMAGTYFRPGDLVLAPILAKQGTKILPALIEQLEKEEKGVSPEHLVLVLDMMAHNYHVQEVKEYAPRIIAWCSHYYTTETFCHKVGHQLMDQQKP
jgi:hypothetical protein